MRLFLVRVGWLVGGGWSAFVKDLVTHELTSKAEVVRVAQDLKRPQFRANEDVWKCSQGQGWWKSVLLKTSLDCGPSERQLPHQRAERDLFGVALNYALISVSCLMRCRSIWSKTNGFSQFLWVGSSPVIIETFVSEWSSVELPKASDVSLSFQSVCDSRRSAGSCQMPYLHAMQTVAGAVQVSQRFTRLEFQSFSSFVWDVPSRLRSDL